MPQPLVNPYKTMTSDGGVSQEKQALGADLVQEEDAEEEKSTNQPVPVPVSEENMINTSAPVANGDLTEDGSLSYDLGNGAQTETTNNSTDTSQQAAGFETLQDQATTIASASESDPLDKVQQETSTLEQEEE